MKYLVLFSIIPLLFHGCKQGHKEAGQIKLSILDSPAGADSSLPYLTKGPEHKTYLSWVAKKGDSTLLKYAYLDESGWSAPYQVAGGTNWFVNWADYPMISILKGGPMLAHFLAKSNGGTYAYDVHITQSPDGQNWSGGLIPHTDGTLTEHGFVTILPYQDRFLVAWLDGRNTSGEDHDDHIGHGAMTIRSAIISADGALENAVELDDRVCDCCQTGGAVTKNGPVIVYRDRSDHEIRDISLVRLLDGKWTEPKTVFEDNWKIAGCPVNGPRASAHGSTLAIAWFSATEQNPQVKVIFSGNNGETFEAPLIIDDTNPIGRVDVSLIDENNAVVSWLDSDSEKALIKAMLVSKEGERKEEFVVAQTDPSRKSGFPQLETIAGEAYFAWTALEEATTRVRLAKLSF